MGIMNLNEVMDKSVEILKRQVKNIVPFTLLFSIILGTIGFFIAMIGMVFVIALFAGINYHSQSPNFVPLIIIGCIIGILIGGAYMGLKAGIAKIVNCDINQERATLGDAMSSAFSSIPKFWAILFLIFLMFLPAVGVFGAILYYLYKAFITLEAMNGQDLRIPGLLFILAVLITILAAYFVVFIYYALFGFTIHAVVIEKKGVIDSIKRSLQLVKGAFWKILGCNVLIALTISALEYSLMSFIGLVFGILFLVLKFFNVSVNAINFITMCYSISSRPINLVSFMLLAPLGNIMTTLLYFNQRFKKEGYDIQLRVNELQRINERKQFGGYYNSYYYPNQIR